MSWSISFSDQVLERMSFLHCEMMGRKESNRFKESSNHSISFIYDSDVIFSFSAPWKRGPSSENISGYGQLLPRLPSQKIVGSALKQRQAEDSDAWHTARLLAKTALGASANGIENRENKILMFEGHRNEVIRHKNHLEEYVSKSKSASFYSTEKTRYARMTKALMGNLISTGVDRSEIINFATTRMEHSLLESFDGRSSGERELENLHIFENKYGSIKNFLLKDYLESENDVFSNLDTTFKQTEYFAEFILKSFWTDRIRKIRPETYSNENSLADINALVDLSILNRRTLEVGYSRRFVFVYW